MSEPTPIVRPISALPGVNVLVEGPTGTGKTYSLGTAADAGVELFVLFLESGVETLAGYWTDRKLPVPPNVHWHVLERPKGGFGLLESLATNINTLNVDSLFKVLDPNRGTYLTLYKAFLNQLTNFVDQRTGKAYGAVDHWGPDKLLALDGLTGLTTLTTGLRIGGAAVKSQADIGIIQDQLEKTLRQLTDGCPCHFALISHVERETDQVFGGVKVTVSTLGKALAPKIPPMFSDVILAKRVGTRYTWSTADQMSDLKARNLAIADDLPPSFQQIFEKWKSRGGVFCQEVAK